MIINMQKYRYKNKKIYIYVYIQRVHTINMATLTSATNNGVDLGLGGGISDEEEEDATIIPY